MISWALRPEARDSVPADIAAKLLRAVGNDNIAYTLMLAVRGALKATHCSVFRMDPQGAPEVEVAGIDSPSSGAECARRYVHSRFYVEDPLRLADSAEAASGLLTLQHASQISTSAYRLACYEAMGFVERCSLLFPRGEIGRVAINFYYNEPHLDGELRLIESLAPLLSGAVEQHFVRKQSQWITGQTRTFLTKWNLSAREEQVILCALHGLSNKEIAKRLDLQPTTVVTYRDRAYKRMGILRHSDLVRILLAPELAPPTCN